MADKRLNGSKSQKDSSIAKKISSIKEAFRARKDPVQQTPCTLKGVKSTPSLIELPAQKESPSAKQASSRDGGNISPSVSPVVPDSASQFRSTLAIGQLIASNRPTAGSRLIASELRQLSKSIHEESASLRKEIANLSTSLAASLKTVLEDEREQRNSISLSRRPMFGPFAHRRFPVYRRPARLMLARKSTANASTSPLSPLAQRRSSGSVSPETTPSTTTTTTATTSTGTSTSSTPTTAAVTTAAATTSNTGSISTAGKQIGSHGVDGQASPQSTSANIANSVKTLRLMFKRAWPLTDRLADAYDGEADTDSDEAPPSVSP